LTKVLIDGDIVAYRSAFATEKDFEDKAAEYIDEFMGGILADTCLFIDESSYEVFLTAKRNGDSPNFRDQIYSAYKANRKDKPRPRHLSFCRDYLIINYNAKESFGAEADDYIATRATELGENAIIASVDKDFLQVPCTFYNVNKREFTKITPEQGLWFFYNQLLVGDSVDNIKGAKGIGPVKAAKILKGAESELDLWKRCLEAYEGDRNAAVLNARLVWLQREKGQIWKPPDRR